jgi:hypothetical protein
MRRGHAQYVHWVGPPGSRRPYLVTRGDADSADESAGDNYNREGEDDGENEDDESEDNDQDGGVEGADNDEKENVNKGADDDEDGDVEGADNDEKENVNEGGGMVLVRSYTLSICEPSPDFLMRPSERDEIDLCSDGEAAIAPQPKQGPQEHIVNIHPGVRQHGAYSREQQPIKPHVGLQGL